MTKKQKILLSLLFVFGMLFAPAFLYAGDGENIAYVHKDLSNVHETMSKMMNPLVDTYRELKKISGG